jgi:hypothetical protein
VVRRFVHPRWRKDGARPEPGMEGVFARSAPGSGNPADCEAGTSRSRGSVTGMRNTSRIGFPPCVSLNARIFYSVGCRFPFIVWSFPRPRLSLLLAQSDELTSIGMWNCVPHMRRVRLHRTVTESFRMLHIFATRSSLVSESLLSRASEILPPFRPNACFRPRLRGESGGFSWVWPPVLAFWPLRRE